MHLQNLADGAVLAVGSVRAGGAGARLLTSFGIWGVEGAGGSWPGSDAALLAVIAFVLLVAAVAVRWLRGLREAVPAGQR
jgi:uncharacterized membrane protein